MKTFTPDDIRVRNARNATKPRRFGRRLVVEAITVEKTKPRSSKVIMLRQSFKGRKYYTSFPQKEAAWLRDMLTEMLNTLERS